MADVKMKTLELAPIDRMWLDACIAAKIQQLKRSKDKEMIGSEIVKLRDREIAELNDLARRLAALA